MIKNTFTLVLGWITLSFCLLFSGNALGNHMTSMRIGYECLGNNQYRVDLFYYTQATTTGTLPPTSINVSWNSSCGSGSVVANKQYEIAVPSRPTFKKVYYQGIVNIPSYCLTVIISSRLCCRRSDVTSISNPIAARTYVEAVINNQWCNSSPILIIMNHY